MDAVGVVCEFDPLHRGHEALLRRAGASGRPVVCAMSGNFTQRGGPACAEKFVRAEMAVRGNLGRTGRPGFDATVSTPSAMEG